MQKAKRERKNKILKTITFIIAVLFLLSASGIDADKYINYIVCVISLAWCVLFLLTNRKVLKSWGRR